MTIDKSPFQDTPIFSRYPPTGISTLVAGAGIAGLSFAIEAHRKGHDVCVIDRRPHFNDYGRMIDMTGLEDKAYMMHRRFHRRSIFCTEDT
jgi:UDP-galactopyranose mutase